MTLWVIWAVLLRGAGQARTASHTGPGFPPGRLQLLPLGLSNPGAGWAGSLSTRRSNPQALSTLALILSAEAGHKAKARVCVGADYPRAWNKGRKNNGGSSLPPATMLRQFNFPEEKQCDDKESKEEHIGTAYSVLQGPPNVIDHVSVLIGLSCPHRAAQTGGSHNRSWFLVVLEAGHPGSAGQGGRVPVQAPFLARS